MAEAPDVELLRAVLDRLRGDRRMIELVGEAIFDRAPEKQAGLPALPLDYVTVGPTDSVPNDFDCVDGQDITVQLDAWSSGPGEAYGSAKVRKIADAMRRSLHQRELQLPLGDNALVTITHTLTRILRDPDGVTSHAAVQFTATVETPSEET